MYTSVLNVLESPPSSLVFLQALRQTRNHHLTSLFPLFPTPRPQPKGKGKAKLKTGGPTDTPTPSTPDPSGNVEEEDPPLPPHAIHPIGRCSLSFGPMRFDEVWLWECRFDVQPSKEEEAERKRRIQAEKVGDPHGVRSIASMLISWRTVHFRLSVSSNKINVEWRNSLNRDLYQPLQAVNPPL